MTSDKNELTVYEKIRDDIDLIEVSEFNLPLAEVFSDDNNGYISSFGGRSLQENAELVDLAIKNTDDLKNVFNSPHTQWVWKHIVLNHESDINNMRQISMEISTRKSSLRAAKWDHIRRQVSIRKLEERLEKGDLDYWGEIETKISLAQRKESLNYGVSLIDGAMKDILALNEVYEELKSRVSDFNEYDYQKEEPKHQLMKSLTQCIRDIRQGGFITKGEQEFLEQCGANPSKIQKILQEYVIKEEESTRWDNRELKAFVRKLAQELIEDHKISEIQSALYGFTDEPNEYLTKNENVALLASEEKDL